MSELSPDRLAELRHYYDQVAPSAWMVEEGKYDPQSPVPAFEQQYGMSFANYLRQDLNGWRRFNLKMEYGLRQMVPTTSVQLLDLPTEGVVADVGGGLGYLLEQAKIEERGRTTILCEQQFVCDQAKATRGNIDQFGTQDILTGNLPRADMYLLTRIMHDWRDNDAQVLLENIRRVATRASQLRIIDVFLDEDRQGPPRALQQQRSMELLYGSKQHTVSEIGALLLSSGWQAVDQPVKLSDDMSFLSASAV